MLMIEASKSAFYRGSAVAACLAAAGLVSGTSASAQLSQPWTWCVNKEKASPDVQIKGCTSVIGSGKETPKNLSVAYNNRGNGYRTKGDNDRAIADYNESIRLDPNYAYPYNGRGNAYRARGENDRAIADYSQSIRLDAKYASPHNGRANSYRDKYGGVPAKMFGTFGSPTRSTNSVLTKFADDVLLMFAASAPV